MQMVQIAGRLGSEPEVRYTPSGQKVTTFRVAVNTRKKGEELTNWWRVTVWGERLDKMLAYLKKGSAVVIWGDMPKPEIFTSRDGVAQVSMELTAEMIKFNPFGRSDSEREDAKNTNAGFSPAKGMNNDFGQQNFENVMAAAPASMDDDDRLPF